MVIIIFCKEQISLLPVTTYTAAVENMLNLYSLFYITGDPFFQSAYRSRSMCWLHEESLHFGFLLPVGVLALFNVVCFIAIMNKICCRKKVVSAFGVLPYRLTLTKTYCFMLKL